MKFKQVADTGDDSSDLTPMIDMTFQLIAFFMVLINFTNAEASDEIKLPDSDLARPPETIPDFRLLLGVESDGKLLRADGLSIKHPYSNLPLIVKSTMPRACGWSGLRSR